MVVKVPASKSLAHRFLIAAALGESPCEVVIDGWSKDLLATRACLEAMKRGEPVWPCGESGTTLRLLTPIAGVMGWKGEFRKEGRLAERPVMPFVRQPRYVVPGNVSSQFVSGLLMALPLADWDSEVVIDGTLQSASYVGLTEDVLRQAGIRIERMTGDVTGWRIRGGQRYALGGRVVVEGDWSSAAAWLAMGVEVEGLNPDSRQGDRAVVRFLEAIAAGGPGTVIDIADTPDLYPVLATYAAFTGRDVKFANVERLRLKESDRLATTEALIASVRRGETVRTFNDHRIAMAAAVAAVLLKRPVAVDDPRCVAKSYPRFWEDFHRLFPGLAETGRLRCGLLGRKLGHSLSLTIHRMFGDYAYRLVEKEPGEVETFLRGDGWDVLNVTIPYKKVAAAVCDEMSETARRLGNVNVVSRRIGSDGKARIFGDNTDAYGFRRLVEAVKGGDGGWVRGRKCLVLGTGGAGTTAATVLADMGARVTVISRHGEDNYGNLDRHADAAAIVNATPVGMYPDVESMPLALDGFDRLEAVIDLVYNLESTRLVREARTRGVPALDGLTMLIAQAWRASADHMGGSLPDGNVYFYGPPGSGKSTMARAVKTALRLPLVDLDETIVAAEGRPIADIFATDGEAAFRAIEKRTFAAVAAEGGRLVSLGGGTLLDPESEALARATGRIVLMTAADEVLWARVSRTTERPLAREREAFMKLLESRRAHYGRFV